MIKPILLVKNKIHNFPVTSGFEVPLVQEALLSIDLSPLTFLSLNLLRASSAGPSAVSSTPKQRAAL
jgi:hypothetical protein